MKELAKIIVAGVSTVALAGGIGAGLAYAGTPTYGEPTTSPTATSVPADTTPTAEPSDKRDQDRFRKRLVRRQLRFIGRALHGEVTLAGEEHRVIVFQRGAVEKVSKTSLTVTSNDPEKPFALTQFLLSNQAISPFGQPGDPAMIALRRLNLGFGSPGPSGAVDRSSDVDSLSTIYL